MRQSFALGLLLVVAGVGCSQSRREEPVGSGDADGAARGTSAPNAARGELPGARGERDPETEERAAEEREAAEPAFDQKAFLAAVAQRQRMKPGGLPAAVGGSRNRTLSLPLNGNWASIGLSNFNGRGVAPFGGRVDAIAAIADGTMIVVGGLGGVMLSADTGTTWSSLSDGWATNSVLSLAARRTGGVLHIFAGSGFNGGFGIRRSLDGGATWSDFATAAFAGRAVADIVIDPSNSQRIFAAPGVAAVGGLSGLQRSEDYGATWTECTPHSNVGFGNISIGIPDAGGVRAYYVAGDATFRSLDSGVTWTQLTVPSGASGTTTRIAASQVDPNTAYLSSLTGAKIYKTTNRGVTWSDSTNGFTGWGTEGTAFGLVATGNGTDTVFAANEGAGSAAHSDNAAGPWSRFADPAGYDFRRFNANTSSPDTVFLGSDQGVVRASTPGNELLNMSANLRMQLTRGVAAHPTDSSSYITHLQDCGGAFTHGNNLTSWGGVLVPEGRGAAINKANGAQQFLAAGGIVYMTNDTWATQVNITPAGGFVGQNVGLYSPIAVDNSPMAKLYVVSNYINRYDTATGTWTFKLGNMPNAGNLVVAPSDPQRIYTAGPTTMWMSTNGGTTWTEIDTGSPSLPASMGVTSISVNPADPNDILVGLFANGPGHVWRLANASAATRVWTNVSGSGAGALPNFAVNAVQRHPDCAATCWFVATSAGAMMTSDSGATWQDITLPRGLPAVKVTDMDTQLGTTPRYLVASTDGRGLWRLELPPAGPQVNLVRVVPATVTHGTPSTGTVRINSTAPAGGVTVALRSSNPSIAAVPASVVIGEGSNVEVFNITTGPSTGAATIYGTTSASEMSAVLTVN